MKEKMTSGEIAKQAGVSPKALLSEHFEKSGKSFWKIIGIKSRNILTV